MNLARLVPLLSGAARHQPREGARLQLPVHARSEGQQDGNRGA